MYRRWYQGLSGSEGTNFFHLVMDIAWFGLALPATARFLSVYAIRLGASAHELMILASVPSLILLIAASIADWWRSHYADSVHAVYLPSLGFRFIFLLPALTPFFPHEWQIPWLILSIAIPALPQGIGTVIFMIMMREAVEERNFMKLLAQRAFALNVTLALGGLAFGFWLEVVPFPLNYQAMYVVAFALTLISLWHVKQTRTLFTAPAQAPADNRLSPYRDPRFQRVALATIVTHMAFFGILPLVTLYLVDERGASEGFIGIFALFELIAGALASVYMAQLSGRLGNRAMVAVSMAFTCLAALIVALAPSLNWTLLAAFLGGAAWTLVSNGIFGYFTENTATEDLTRYTKAFNQVIFFSLFIGPLAGSLLLDLQIDLINIILIGAVLRLLAGVYTWLAPSFTLRPAQHAVEVI